MSTPVLTLFNNKGGVGKTSLSYHLACMFSELGVSVLAADFDPQANLTAAFLSEERLEALWAEQSAPTTVFRCIKPLLDVGDILPGRVVEIANTLSLLPGDLALSGFEDALADAWPQTLGEANLERPFRVVTALWRLLQRAARECGAQIIVVDVGPHLGALNRSALVATDHVLIPVAADLFSLAGLANLGPTLRRWRAQWEKRHDNWQSRSFELPSGQMRPLGYIVQQHVMRLTRPVRAYNRWAARIPAQYRTSVLDEPPDENLTLENDVHCLAQIRHYQSLAPLAMEARKPIFQLTVADGAMGAHAESVKRAYIDYAALATRVLERIGLGSQIVRYGRS